MARVVLAKMEARDNVPAEPLNAIVGLSELREHLEFREHLTLIAPKHIASN